MTGLTSLVRTTAKAGNRSFKPLFGVKMVELIKSRFSMDEQTIQAERIHVVNGGGHH